MASLYQHSIKAGRQTPLCINSPNTRKGFNLHHGMPNAATPQDSTKRQLPQGFTTGLKSSQPSNQPGGWPTTCWLWG
jgi:hypothetical protein